MEDKTVEELCDNLRFLLNAVFKWEVVPRMEPLIKETLGKAWEAGAESA